MDLDPEVESTGTREHVRAAESLHTAEQDIVHTTAVISRFEAAMGTLVRFHEANHFRENALKIMRAPARKSAEDAA
jgi:hypothetical protein